VHLERRPSGAGWPTPPGGGVPVAYLALPAGAGHVSGNSGRTDAAGRRAALLRWPPGLRRRVVGMLLCHGLVPATSGLPT
jgi:hypothetical protein